MRRMVLVEMLENRTLLAAVPVISGNGTTIANGDTTPDRTDATDFSWTEAGGSMQRQYTIKNTGDANLTVSAPVISGANAASFSVVSVPTSPIAPGQTGTLVLKFAPTVAGTYDATVDVPTDSPTVPDYSFAVSGSGIKTVALKNGLHYGVIAAGSGTKASPGMLLTMNYTGWLRGNGSVFDSSLNPGRTPFEFIMGVGQVIQGWDQGLVGAKIGERRVLFIPSALGYGTQGSGSIPPNADLVFETQVLNAQTMSQYFSHISFSGQNQIIPNHSSKWSSVNSTAFYSTGQAVTQNVVLDLYSSAIPRVAMLPTITGSGAAQFKVGNPSFVSDQKYAIPITYTRVAGKASDAKVVFRLGLRGSPTYSFSIHGETLAPGVTLSSGALAVAGSAGNDVVSLSRSGSYYSLKSNGATNRFNTNSVSSVSLSGGTGDDKITVSTSVTMGVTINGGDGRNTLVGGNGPDVITGGSGDDSINGNGGNDIIDGGDGNNRMLGGTGDDVLAGHNGNDTIDGGAGNDTLTGGLGQDSLIGGSGANVFYAADGIADVLDGRAGKGNTGQWDQGLDVIRGVVTLLT